MGGWCEPAGFSPDGRWLAVQRLTERSGDNDLYLVDVEEGSILHVSPHDDEAEFEAPAWLPDSSAFFFASNTGRETSAIARYEVAARSWSYVVEPDWDADCLIDWSGSPLLATTNEEGYTRARLLDPWTLRPLAEVPLPGRGVAV